MCKFIGKSNERILCKLSKSEILRLHSIVHVAMETTKMTNFTCQSKSGTDYCQNLLSVYFSLAKFQLVSGNPSLAIICQMTYIYSQTVKTVFSNLKISLSLQNISTQGHGQHTMGGHCPEALSLNPLSPVALFTFQRRVGRFSNLTRKGWKVYHI